MVSLLFCHLKLSGRVVGVKSSQTSAKMLKASKSMQGPAGPEVLERQATLTATVAPFLPAPPVKILSMVPSDLKSEYRPQAPPTIVVS